MPPSQASCSGITLGLPSPLPVETVSAPDRLAKIFCLRNKCYVNKDLTLKYDHKRIPLEVNELTRGLVGKHANTYESDRRIQVRPMASSFPAILDPHQHRVTLIATTDNRHVSAVLAHIEAEQDRAAASAHVRPESARNGYRKNGRRNNGWNSLTVRKRIADRKASQGDDIRSPPCRGAMREIG